MRSKWTKQTILPVLHTLADMTEGGQLSQNVHRAHGRRKMINRRELPIEAVRELARDRSERSSIRQVADQMGLGHSTLANFLKGASPHPRIRRALAEWYFREIGSGGDEYPDVAYASAVQVLVAGLPERGRGAAAEDVVALLERLHEKNGLQKPGWLERLRVVEAREGNAEG